MACFEKNMTKLERENDIMMMIFCDSDGLIFCDSDGAFATRYASTNSFLVQ